MSSFQHGFKIWEFVCWCAAVRWMTVVVNLAVAMTALVVRAVNDSSTDRFFSHFPLSGQTDTLLNYELACKNKPPQLVVRSYFQGRLKTFHLLLHSLEEDR